MPYRILLVEDDEIFIEELTECLHEYNIVPAQTGKEALSIIKKPHLFDLIILDFKLPDMKGTDVLREMKKISPDIGIIILTGQSTKDVAIEALKGAADDYFEKPFPVEGLKNAIQQILRTDRNKSQADDRRSYPRDITGKIELAKRLAQNNFDKRVGLKDVAEELCLSPKYFSRVFKKHTGKSFSEYRLRIKMEEAKRLFKDENLRINEVAQKLGYEELKSLTRLFKKYLGCTPSLYRSKSSKSKKRSRISKTVGSVILK